MHGRAFMLYMLSGADGRGGAALLELALLILPGKTQARHGAGKGGPGHLHLPHTLFLAKPFFSPASGFLRPAHVYILRPFAGLHKYNGAAVINLDKSLGTDRLPPSSLMRSVPTTIGATKGAWSARMDTCPSGASNINASTSPI